MTSIRIKRSTTAVAFPALDEGELAHSEALAGQLAVGTTAANDIIRSYPAADGAKLAAIEANATADQTGAEIKAAYEAEADTNAFTDALATKLAGLDENHYKGTHVSLAALNTAHPTAVAGDYADVDAGAAADVVRYIWDVTDTAWVEQSGAVGSETAASIKTKYESNANTNAFDDAAQTKLAGVEANATADQTGAEIKAAYEAEADTNAFTDAEKAKLAAASITNSHIEQVDTPATFGGANFLVAVNPTNDGLVHVDVIDGGTFA